jgi:para-aminobenzoate synthetase/4-amino-4-deoxychorismate lyase
MTIESIFEKYLNNDNSAFFYTPAIYKDGYSYIFNNPAVIISAENQKELLNAFDLIEEQKRNGRTGYGFLKYEAGYYLEEKFLKYRKENNAGLLKFCFFDEKNTIKIKSDEIDFTSGGFSKEYNIRELTYSKNKDEFVKDIQSIKHFIEEGDTYQVNYTMKCNFKVEGNLLSLFKSLVFNQSAEYTAFINNGENIIISVSPELFFSIKGNEIVCKPMKGTIKRGINPGNDLFHYNTLQSEDKFHAENLMILDLLRNDLGKISKYNSVNVNKLYSVEKYESLFQLISEVRAGLKDNISLKEIFKSIFPCGSVTGTPKIRTMEIINKLEKEDRGLYTGAVGLFLPDKTVFNVAIRTITIDKETRNGKAGIGSGITWDSDPVSEYNETLLKSKFLTDPDEYFEIFETMLIENGKVFLWDYHLQRLKQSADYFLFNYDEEKLNFDLQNLLSRTESGKKYRLKLTLNKWGGTNFTITDFPDITKPVKIIISNKKILSENRFQYFKTTNRKLYNDEYKHYSNNGFYDVIYFNEMDQLAEGAITNVFIKKDNIWYTPAIESGILAGVYRKYFIGKNRGNVIEKEISKDELFNADEVVLTNSLRGEIKVEKLFHGKEEIKHF